MKALPPAMCVALLMSAVPGCAPTARSLQDATEVFAPGVISDDNWQWRITFTPDGRTAYFAESPDFFPVSRTATIYESRFDGTVWSEPIVAPFSGTFSDMDPFVTPDGSRLYFSSIRPVDGVERADLDLWLVERQGSGWSEPTRLGTEVNSADDELYASVSNDGTLYFASGPMRPEAGKHWDIFRAPRVGNGFGPREALGPAVNTHPSSSDSGSQAAWDFNPEISPDGTLLLFTSLRPGGAGLGDLYGSRFRDGAWTTAENLGAPVNSSADEYHPTLSRDGRLLYFVRRGPNGGEFHRVDVDAISALRRRAPARPSGRP